LRGCMITEGMRADDKTARDMAHVFGQAGADAIHAYVEAKLPKRARQITDYVLVTMRGLSSFACLGMTHARLIAVARMAGHALESEFTPGGRS
jgi:TetR/AcrR family transcriptional repressor for divergent bdcA